MTFLKSAALFAAIGLGITNVATPGLAFELDRTPLVSTALSLTIPQPLPIVAPTPRPAMIQAVPQDDSDQAAEDNDDPDYASLSAAVDDQSIPSDMDEDLRCLAGAIYFESKGEPLSGQLAVADVILNRTKSGRFPKSVCSVVTQRGQFSFVRRGAIPAIRNNGAYRTAIAVAKVALADVWDSPASGALYFHARYARPGWGKKQVASIGNHLFFR